MIVIFFYKVQAFDKNCCRINIIYFTGTGFFSFLQSLVTCSCHSVNHLAMDGRKIKYQVYKKATPVMEWLCGHYLSVLFEREMSTDRLLILLAD